MTFFSQNETFKDYILIKFNAKTCFRNDLQQLLHSQKIGKENNLKVFGNMKTKGNNKQDRQKLNKITYAWGGRTLGLIIVTRPRISTLNKPCLYHEHILKLYLSVKKGIHEWTKWNIHWCIYGTIMSDVRRCHRINHQSISS